MSFWFIRTPNATPGKLVQFLFQHHAVSSPMDSPSPPSYLAAHASAAGAPRDAALAWFRAARYGLFMHYGLYSLLGRHEWVQFRQTIPVAEYAELAERFTAENFDAEAWARFAVDCGMGYINLTTRHHDSFCLWDTAASDFKSTNTPARRDLVAELAEACDRHGLGLCLYYSHGRDWRHPHAPNNDRFGGGARPAYDPPDPAYAYGAEHELDRYVDFMSAQVEELLTGYGPIAAIWLDGIATPLHPKDASGEVRENYDPRTDGDPFRCQALYDRIHALQPHCLVSYKQGYLGTEDFFAPEHRAYNRFDQPFTEVPGEVCTTMIAEPGSWGYYAGAHVRHRTEAEVWEALEAAGASHCNLLLNTGPKPDGSLDERDAPVLRAIGGRLAREGFPAP